MSNLIFDGAVALLLLAALWRGYKRGFVLTLCSFLAVFVAFIGATIISNTMAEPVGKAIVPVVESSIHDRVTSYYQRASEAGASHQGSDWLAQLPLEEVLEPMKESKFFEGLTSAFQSAVEAGAAEVAANAAHALAEYAAAQLARMVLFLLSFVAVLAAWFLLSHALDLAFRLPVLSTLNRWSGAALGLAKGCALLFIACWLLKDSFIPQEIIEQTCLLRFFCTYDPFTLLP